MADQHVSLTIYNQGTALVRDQRTVSLKEGLNTLDFTDVTAQIDATSVVFAAVDAPDTVVLEQNYLFDLVGGDALLRRYLEQTIEITLEDGTRYTGELLNTPDTNRYGDAPGGDVILRLMDGQIAYARTDKIRDIRFPSLPGGLITRPTLRWLLHSARAGAQPVEITYLTGGMNWTADYNLLLATDNRRFDITGWVTLTNTSGATFTDAQVKLVAGEVKRMPAPGTLRKEVFAARAMAAPPPPQVEQREIFEYQLYEISRSVTVANNETKQVEFVAARGVQAERQYIFTTPTPFIAYGSQPYFDRGQTLQGGTVQVWLEFSTGDDSGLGADLPAGRLRAYQADADGSAVLIGENTIKHTPKGERVRLELGNAFDLVGERQQIRFSQPRKNIVEESYRITLRNRKDAETAQIRVPERLFRWNNWQIISPSHAYTPLDAATIEFRVDVPPGGETAITYTVRYDWDG